MILFNMSVTNRRAKQLRFHQKAPLGHDLISRFDPGNNPDHPLRRVTSLDRTHDEMVCGQTNKDCVLPIHLLHGVLRHQQPCLLLAHR